jgi:Glycosyltransferase
MKVAIFAETYLPYINGVVTHVASLVDGLKTLGHDVMVVTADPKIRHQTFIDGVLHCPAISLKRFYDFGIAPPLSNKRRNAIAGFNPDVIHVHQEFGIGFSGVRAALSLNIPYVYTMHTMYDDYIYYIAPGKLVPIIKKPVRKYAKYIANRAAEITGPSEKVTEYLRSCGCNKPVTVIPNPVEIDLFDTAKLPEGSAFDIRQRFGFKDSDTVLTFCGRLGTEKNVHTLVDYWAEALKENKNIKLFILGDGPAKDKLEIQAKELGIESQVKFAGVVAHGDLPPYLVAADAYVTASLSDTNSISMLEGMAMKLPVFHIKDPLNQGQVVPGHNGFIYENAGQLRDEILDFVALSNEEKTKLREQTRESVLEKGSVTLAKNLLEVYKKALLK